MTPEQYAALERRIDKAVTEILAEACPDMTPVHVAVIVDSLTNRNGTAARL